MENLLAKLRSIRMQDKVIAPDSVLHEIPYQELLRSGVKLASSSRQLENQFYRGLMELFQCMKPSPSSNFIPILYEGDSYPGCWLESTGTINVERLDRFCPSVSKNSYEAFADHQREDGLFPFMVNASGGSYTHIQIVSPLARCVWNHYLLNGKDKAFLQKMYTAMAKYDEWIVRNRNTRSTGCVEAFCVWDTGHDMSPRFWHVPDTTPNNDAAQCWDNSLLPYLAPDLTANIYIQRKYLALIAAELGEPHEPWELKSQSMHHSLMENCFDEVDQFFYDLDRNGKLIKIQSDVLMRVLACEVGDADYFRHVLERYLLHTRKFFARYPLTSIAIDDPRFDRDFSYNSWSGTTNMLTLIRAPHAFELHGHHVELTWVMLPAIFAIAHMKEFAQNVSPWTGHEGFSSRYTPAMLTMFDFIERICGILPTPDQELWFTGLTLVQYEGYGNFGNEVAYSRTIDGHEFEIINGASETAVYRDRELLYEFSKGIRLITDRSGHLISILGMSISPINGSIQYKGTKINFIIKGNEVQKYTGVSFESVFDPGVITPTV
jgi:hypothetical protein